MLVLDIMFVDSNILKMINNKCIYYVAQKKKKPKSANVRTWKNATGATGCYGNIRIYIYIYLYGRVVSKTYLLQKYTGITIISIYRQALGKRRGYSGGSVLHSGPLMHLS